MSDPRRPQGCVCLYAARTGRIHSVACPIHNSINPQEGASPAVDASGEPGFPPEWIAANRRSLDLPDKQPQPARHELSIQWELNGAGPLDAQGVQEMVRALDAQAAESDAQAAEIAEIRNTVRNALSEIRKLHPENAALRKAQEKAVAIIDDAIKNAKAEWGQTVKFLLHKARAALKGTGDE